MNRSPQSFALICALLVGLAGCGGTDDVRTTPTTEPPDADALQAQVGVSSARLQSNEGVITTNGLAALYRFHESAGAIVDSSGVVSPEPLVAADPDLVRWSSDAPSLLLLPGGSLVADVTDDPQIRFDDGVALELWIDPTDRTGVVATVEGAGGNELRLQTERSPKGIELVADFAGGRFASRAPLGEDPGLTHVLLSVTEDASWFIVNGVERGADAGLGRMPAPERVVVGEPDGTWAGGVSMVALYTRPVLAPEAEAHHAAGPLGLVTDGPSLTATGDVLVEVDQPFEQTMSYFDPLARRATVRVTSELAVTTDADESSIVIIGTPSRDDVGQHLVTVEVSAGGRVASVAFLVNVVEGPATITEWVTSSTLDAEGEPMILPTEVAAGPTGVFVSDYGGNRVYRVVPGGIERVVGSGVADYAGDGGPADLAAVFNPSGIAVTADGGLVVADHSNHRVRLMDARGNMRTVAGVGIASYSGDGGVATLASLDSPEGVAVMEDGTILVADFENRRVRAIDGFGGISTFLGTGATGRPTPGVFRTDADLGSPSHIVVAPSGTVFVSDIAQDQVWSVDPDGIVQLVAGSGVRGGAGDGGRATAAQLNQPSGLALDSLGRLLIADTGNLRIRRVELDGSLATVAGNGSPDWATDGSNAKETGMHPDGIAFTPEGLLIVVDQNAGVVAAIDGL